MFIYFDDDEKSERKVLKISKYLYYIYNVKIHFCKNIYSSSLIGLF